LLPIETGLDGIPALALAEGDAARLRNGQRVTPGDPGEWVDFHRLNEGAVVSAWDRQALVALVRIESGGLRPVRVINL
jgi:tRNA pseudouridine55 synthase